jgi:low affinity Fe/Cu permease
MNEQSSGCPAKPNGNDWFRRVAQKTSQLIGCAWAFMLALVIILAWALSGPFFHFSDTWQLVINTGTTIVTFLVVFLIQNTQNRDAKAIHLKLDELIHAMKGARNQLINLENLTDDELANLQREFERIRKRNTPPAKPKTERELAQQNT